jgi:hypothetical protein
MARKANVQTGIKMSPDDVDQLTKLRDALKPEASWTRLDTFGKWLFGTVATVGVLGAGFSNSSFQRLEGAGKYAFAAAVLFAGISLAFAVRGLAPQLMNFSVNSRESMRAEISKQIAQRQGTLKWSAWFLAFAFVTASGAPLLSGFPANDPAPEPRVVVTYSLAADGKLQVEAKGSGLEKHAPVELALVARPKLANTLMPRVRAAADGEGKAQLKVELQAVNKLKSKLFATVAWTEPATQPDAPAASKQQEVEIRNKGSE